MLERLNKLRDQSGHVTIFLTLLFLVIMGVGFLVFGGMREYLKQSLVEDTMTLAGEDILAQYDRPLFDRYHLFFMDPKEVSDITNDAKTRVEDSFGAFGVFKGINMEFSVNEKKTPMDEKGQPVLSQIKAWETCQGIQQLPAMIQQLLESTEKKTVDLTEYENTGEEKKSDEKTEEEDEDTEKEKEVKRNWKEWKETLEMVLHSGILLYVLDEPGSVSNLQISKTNLPSKELGSAFSFLNLDSLSLTSFSDLKNLYQKQDTSKWNKNLLSSDVYLIPYIQDCFQDYDNKDSSRKHCLKYEKEYLIGGKTKDRDNLKYVADQIFLLRFVVNYGYAMFSPDIKPQAEAMATILTGVLGFPQAEGAVANLLIASLCYGESLLEVHALFQGHPVALTKNSSNWNLSFANAVVKLKSKSNLVGVGKGVTYEQYLIGLLIMKSTSRSLLYRMMDMMQCNVALEEPDFLLKKSLYSFQWTGKCSWNPFFQKIPAMGISWKDPFTLSLSQEIAYQ